MPHRKVVLYGKQQVSSAFDLLTNTANLVVTLCKVALLRASAVKQQTEVAARAQGSRGSSFEKTPNVGAGSARE